DISGEPGHVLDLYGIGDSATEEFGRQLLLARRLAERGARFIQVCHPGRGNGGRGAPGDTPGPRPPCPGAPQATARTHPRHTAGPTGPWSSGPANAAGAPGGRTRQAETTPRGATRPGWPAAASRAGPFTARPTTSATRRSRARTTTATCTRRSSTSSALTTR